MRITVPGRELKSAFKDMSGLLRKYDQARVIGISTTKDKITFTVDAGTYYSRSILFIPVMDVIELQLTVLFTDLSYFISGREDAQLEITEFYVQIKSKGATLTLNVGESIVAPYQPRGGKVVDLNFGLLRQTVNVFSKTQELQKAFSREFAVAFYGDRALMKTPTLWIETVSQGLECVLSVDQMKSILMFLPEKVEVSDRLEFRKGNAILSLPKLTPVEQSHMSTYVDKMVPVSYFDPSGFTKELAEIKRVVGVSECELRFSVEGFNIRIEKSGVAIEKSCGTVSDTTMVFKYPLDLFVMCLTILGEDEPITILRGEGLACLKNTVTFILLSVLN